MARPHVFPRDTTLYHATEGARVFPQGETDPGAAWTDAPGGVAPGASTNDAALKDLAAATAKIEELQRQLVSMSQDLQLAAGERDAANARAEAADRRAADLQQALDAFAGAPDRRTVETPAEVAGVVIPEGWEKLPFLSIKALASKVSPTPVKTKEEVFGAIRRHLGLIPA